MTSVLDKAQAALQEHHLAEPHTPVLLMVSGGSDSTALAYVAAQLQEQGLLGALAILHVNHQLRGADANGDQAFVEELAALLNIPCTVVSVDVRTLAQNERGNVEAVARRERYDAAHHALAELCQCEGMPISQGRIFVAHTADDRVENFFMRSIVGTGPGGFRSMRYLNGQVARPLLECGRQDLRDYIHQRAAQQLPVMRDAQHQLWREDATNQHTDRFRAYVRHEMVPRALERNPRLLQTLTRTMNLIADEDDLMEALASDILQSQVVWLQPEEEGCVIQPLFATQPLPLQRRVVFKVLKRMMGPDVRVENAAVDGVLAGFIDGKPNSGYVTNIQCNLAVSANKHGVRVEPMASFRTRRNKIRSQRS